jgi:predicted short-subunit dehydrogenase-like oxidoreductase (DUF2520 family)
VTASVHPIQSFPQKRPLPDVFQNIYFGLEGQTEGLELAKRLVRKLGGKHIILAPKDKPLYHTACTMVSNFFVALLDTAFFLFEQMGFEKDQASQILMPLVQGTLQNVKKFNTTEALTGPAARGDENSIRTHLQALRPFPDSYNLYLKITSQILLFAKKEKRISAKKIKALKALLEDK